MTRICEMLLDLDVSSMKIGVYGDDSRPRNLNKGSLRVAIGMPTGHNGLKKLNGTKSEYDTIGPTRTYNIDNIVTNKRFYFCTIEELVNK